MYIWILDYIKTLVVKTFRLKEFMLPNTFCIQSKYPTLQLLHMVYPFHLSDLHLLGLWHPAFLLMKLFVLL